MSINAKEKQVIVKVKIFGEEIAEFHMRSNDSTITSDVIAGYINTLKGDDEARKVTGEILRVMGYNATRILVNFGDNGELLREVLEASVDIAPTEQLRENALRLRRVVLPLLGRVYFDATNKLTPKEQRRYCGYKTCEDVVTTLVAHSMIDDGIMAFSAKIYH